MEATLIKEKESQFIMPTYGRYDLAIDHGKGSYVFDFSGKKYLDFIAGIACVPVGHANPKVVSAISAEAKKLTHVSNLYYTKPQVELAEKLISLSGLNKCFFCNSGAEANEAAIKLAKKLTGKKEFIVFDHAFHGRTHGSLSATWKPEYKEKFRPLVDGFRFVPYNEMHAIEETINEDTAAIMVEPIQGEAGVIIPSPDFLQKIAELCEQKRIMLIVDEVQTGNGRTGKYFCYEYSGIKPDIVTTAKGLANGLPIGVCISKHEFEKSEHASTFGGNNIVCAAANATIDYILEHRLMENAVRQGELFMKLLRLLPKVKEVRGKGLIIAADLDADAKAVCNECLKKGLLVNNATNYTLRFLPPLTVSESEVRKAVKILADVLKDA